MRFLILASIFACVAAKPAPVAPAQPTISPGDINGAAIEAQALASDQLRAAADADRQLNDKVSELHGQAINNAEEQAWRQVDALKTVEAKLDAEAARLDGATASSAPVIAKNIVRSQGIAPVAPIAPAASASYTAPAAPIAPAASASYTAPAAPVASAASVSYTASAAPIAPAASVSYTAPVAQVAPVSPFAYNNVPTYDTSFAYDAPFSYTEPFAYPDAQFGFPESLNF